MVCCAKKRGAAAQPVGIGILVTITYCLVAAGPYGIEEAVAAAGPFYTVVMLAVTAIVLAFPISLIFSEMSNIFQQTGSTILWALDIPRGI